MLTSRATAELILLFGIFAKLPSGGKVFCFVSVLGFVEGKAGLGVVSQRRWYDAVRSRCQADG